MNAERMSPLSSPAPPEQISPSVAPNERVLGEYQNLPVQVLRGAGAAILKGLEVARPVQRASRLINAIRQSRGAEMPGRRNDLTLNSEPSIENQSAIESEPALVRPAVISGDSEPVLRQVMPDTDEKVAQPLINRRPDWFVPTDHNGYGMAMGQNGNFTFALDASSPLLTPSTTAKPRPPRPMPAQPARRRPYHENNRGEAAPASNRNTERSVEPLLSPQARRQAALREIRAERARRPYPPSREGRVAPPRRRERGVVSEFSRDRPWGSAPRPLTNAEKQAMGIPF